MKITTYLICLFLCILAGYGGGSKNFALLMYCLPMILVLCVDSIVDAIKEKK